MSYSIVVTLMQGGKEHLRSNKVTSPSLPCFFATLIEADLIGSLNYRALSYPCIPDVMHLLDNTVQISECITHNNFFLGAGQKIKKN